MAKRKTVAEEVFTEAPSEAPPEAPAEAPTEAGPDTPEEKAAIFYKLLQELKTMGVPVTPENLSLLIRNRHPEVVLTTEDIPAVVEAINRLKTARPPETPPAPTISSALSIIKSLVQKFGKDELKRIIDLFD